MIDSIYYMKVMFVIYKDLKHFNDIENSIYTECDSKIGFSSAKNQQARNIKTID